MKNLFATAASVLVLGFAVPAMAQTNTSTTFQNGTGAQNIGITQIGGEATNISNAYQGFYDPANSHNNTISVHQDGDDGVANRSDVVQDGSTNFASATQNGINDVSNTSTILQGGGNNVAVATQSGSNGLTNSSYISQVGSDHYANVDQSGNGDGDSNSSTIVQTGVSQNAVVIQADLRNDNTSFINQYNDDNNARVEQGDLPGLPVDLNNSNLSTILQDGHLNGANVYQGGPNVVSNTSTVSQFGTGNNATVNQH